MRKTFVFTALMAVLTMAVALAYASPPNSSSDNQILIFQPAPAGIQTLNVSHFQSLDHAVAMPVVAMEIPGERAKSQRIPRRFDVIPDLYQSRAIEVVSWPKLN